MFFLRIGEAKYLFEIKQLKINFTSY